MTLADRLDDIGKPAWIGLVILGFVVFWPLGFVALGYMIGSKRMGCWKRQSAYGSPHWEDHMDRAQDRLQRHMERAHERVQEHFERAQEKLRRHAARWAGGGGQQRSSGNRAFDEYRADTLRRLEEEQREFMEFLDRLRHAKDKVEFDQFMAERRSRPENPAPPPPSPPQY
jgi:hypothetical protein